MKVMLARVMPATALRVMALRGTKAMRAMEVRGTTVMAAATAIATAMGVTRTTTDPEQRPSRKVVRWLRV